jgi:hypothetical protein
LKLRRGIGEAPLDGGSATGVLVTDEYERRSVMPTQRTRPVSGSWRKAI